MALRLDELVTALSGSVIEAQHQIRQAHIGQLWSFFKDNAPIKVDLTIPRPMPGSTEPQQATVSVPLLCLVNPAQLSIQEMQITMQVDMSEILASSGSATPRDVAGPAVEPAYAWRPEDYNPLIAVSTTTGKKAGQPGSAQLTLKVSTEDVPEGLARLIEHLNKCL